jgi:hypothetical protein
MTGRRSLKNRPQRRSVTLENFIGRYHRVFVAVMSLLGCAGLVLIVWRWRKLRLRDPLNSVLVLLAASVLLRVTLFAYLDATWWIGGYERYLFPVMPLYSCFLILLIYQAWSVSRRAPLRSAESALSSYPGASPQELGHITNLSAEGAIQRPEQRIWFYSEMAL